MTPWLMLLAVLAHPPTAPINKRLEISGQVSFLIDSLPRRDVAELRPQATLDLTAQAGRSLRLKFDVLAEGLVGDRNGVVTDGLLRARDVWIESSGKRGDIRAGYGRLIWGRLDEVQPSDVINPLNTARYLFDGRSDARLPVAFVRGRMFVSESVTLEGILTPLFRRGSFDELDEASSPFNLLKDVVVPPGVAVTAPEPAWRWANMSGGGRITATVGRVDVAAGAYRGFEGFGLYPRFTMVSGDFETVTGQWAWRGEAAMFVDKSLPSAKRLGLVHGRAFDAGAGFDRRTGDYRVFGSAILHREWSDEDPGVDRSDVDLVGSIERQFRRDRYLVRVFGVLNPGDVSGFVRGIVVWKARDNVSVEMSAAAFPGTGDDTLSRFRTRDFLFARIRWQY